MEFNKHTKIKLTVVTMTTLTFLFLFSAIVTIAPLQQVDGLSIDDSGADDIASGKSDQTGQQDDIGNIAKSLPTTTPIPSSVPMVGCAMDTIESLQSFLSCLGAK
jgi:hypothetical protein